MEALLPRFRATHTRIDLAKSPGLPADGALYVNDQCGFSRATLVVDGQPMHESTNVIKQPLACALPT